MPQVARSKSKDKKVSKEPPKAASKPSSAGVSASGYNPLLRTFQSFDTAPGNSNSALHVNGRFGIIDELDDLDGLSHGAGGECETVSNNGSWSGEEDHKEKTSNLPLRQETLVGADNDKREKIRQKNEKKHQRQKEKRAQELHEKCSGYLMSRKLETLAEQLVAMGFSSEQATMALILNEGRVEESVAWLLEGHEEANKEKGQSADTEGSLKIDISEEFSRIADMEIRFNCSKQDIERAVVACEGDLERAENMLRSQKQELPSVPPKPEETTDPPAMGNDKLPIGTTQNLTEVPVKPSPSSTIPAKRDDKDFGYTEVVAPAGPSVDPESKNIPFLERAHLKLDRGKAPLVSVPVEKSSPNPGPNPSVACSLPSSLQVSLPPAKTEALYVSVGNELKHQQIGTAREPVKVMQPPQSVNARPTPVSNVTSSLPGTAPPFFPRNIVRTVTPQCMAPHIPGTRALSSMSAVGTNHQLYNQLHHQQYQHPGQFVSGFRMLESPGTTRGNSLWNWTGGSSQPQSVAAASSPRIFSGSGTNATYGLPSPVDWSTDGGAVMHVDYKNIDWSLDYGSSSSGSGGVWTTTNPLMQHYDRKYDSFYHGIAAKPTSKLVLPNDIGVPNPGLQYKGVSKAETSAVGSSRQETSTVGGSCQQTSVAAGSRQQMSTVGGSCQQISAAGGSREWPSTSTLGGSRQQTSAAVGSCAWTSMSTLGGFCQQTSAAGGSRQQASAAVGSREWTSTSTLGGSRQQTSAAVGSREWMSTSTLGGSHQHTCAAAGSREWTSMSTLGGSRQQTSAAVGSREWTSTSTSGGSHVWTSPFEERDLFSLPRQLVSSPSL